jgi:hypothetical protein
MSQEVPQSNIDSVIQIIQHSLRVHELKALCKNCGLRCNENKPVLIQSLLQYFMYLRNEYIADKTDTRFRNLVELIINANPVIHYYNTTQNQAPNVLPLPTAIRPTLPIAIRPASSTSTNTTTNKTQPANPPQSTRPFDLLTFVESPFFIPRSRLLCKVVDGRTGAFTITDFVIPQAALQMIQNSPKKYSIRMYMGNPQNTPSFGVEKKMDLFWAESCYIQVNDRAVQQNAFQPSRKKLWVSFIAKTL